MEESRRQFMLQTAQRSALAAGGLMLLDPVDLLGATLGRYHVVKRGKTSRSLPSAMASR